MIAQGAGIFGINEFLAGTDFFRLVPDRMLQDD
jgi:hypothetical protein